MRTLHIALRVSELDRSRAFCAAVGYEVVGEVAETSIGLRALAGHGIEPVGPVHDGGGDAPTTTLIADPDGRRIELVQWPPGHADGMTAADWAEGGE
ncbi:VOC family protein [Amycolatopsis sp. NPDC003861]